MRILLVDDHRVFASTVAETFLARHHVEFAGTLKEARKRLSEGRYDFILLDYDLEDRKGTELLGELGATNRPFVVAISAHETGNRALLAAGADAVCAKAEFASIGAVVELCW